MTYRLVGENIVFRTSPDSILGELAHPVAVCFQIDDLDPETSTGWTVLVQGETSEFVADLPETSPAPWAPGDRQLTVMITPASYSGRAVSAG